MTERGDIDTTVFPDSLPEWQRQAIKAAKEPAPDDEQRIIVAAHDEDSDEFIFVRVNPAQAQNLARGLIRSIVELEASQEPGPLDHGRHLAEVVDEVNEDDGSVVHRDAIVGPDFLAGPLITVPDSPEPRVLDLDPIIDGYVSEVWQGKHAAGQRFFIQRDGYDRMTYTGTDGELYDSAFESQMVEVTPIVTHRAGLTK